MENKSFIENLVLLKESASLKRVIFGVNERLLYLFAEPSDNSTVNFAVKIFVFYPAVISWSFMQEIGNIRNAFYCRRYQA